jgi:hypothetical protein
VSCLGWFVVVGSEDCLESDISAWMYIICDCIIQYLPPHSWNRIHKHTHAHKRTHTRRRIAESSPSCLSRSSLSQGPRDRLRRHAGAPTRRRRAMADGRNPRASSDRRRRQRTIEPAPRRVAAAAGDMHGTLTPHTGYTHTCRHTHTHTHTQTDRRTDGRTCTQTHHTATQCGPHSPAHTHTRTHTLAHTHIGQVGVVDGRRRGAATAMAEAAARRWQSAADVCEKCGTLMVEIYFERTITLILWVPSPLKFIIIYYFD